MADLKPPLAGYSLWLESNDEEKRFFQGLINALAVRYGGQRFDPHVTLLSLLNWPEDKFEEAQYHLDSLVEGVKIFSLELIGIGRRDQYFQSVFLPAVPTPEL